MTGQYWSVASCQSSVVRYGELTAICPPTPETWQLPNTVHIRGVQETPSQFVLGDPPHLVPQGGTTLSPKGAKVVNSN